MGTPEQRERFLGIFRDRTQPRWAAFAMTEPGAGSDVARIQTRARKDGDGWILTGEKMFCSNAARASWIVVFATIDPTLGRDGHRAFVVENPTPGFTILRLENKLGVRAYETCTFVLEDCRVPGDNLLGGEAYYEARAKRGFKGAMAAFNASRPPYAGQAVGIARCAYDIARAFVLSEFPEHGARRRVALDRLTTIRRGIQTARLLALRSAWLLDIGEPNAVEASCAKLYAAPMARLAVSAAMDIVGEAGVARDALLEKLYRDVKILDIGEGTQQVQRRLVARHLVGLPSD
jgi:acyl-CoA dehydrogenase